jgi:HEAT repeat protein
MLIRAATSDSNNTTRNTAVEALGQIGGRVDAYRLKLATKDRDWVVRASAVSSLATSIGIPARASIEQCLRSDLNPVVRAYAAVALCDAVGVAAFDSLSTAMKSERNSIALSGYLAAFLSIKKLDEASTLTSLLKDSKRIARERTISAIEASLDAIKDSGVESVRSWSSALKAQIERESIERLKDRYASALSALLKPAGT